MLVKRDPIFESALVDHGCCLTMDNASTADRSQPNNFDFIRLLAASMVLYSHQFALSGRPEPRPFGLLTLGTLGVLVFFSISGHLVAQSWDGDPHLLRFAAKRFLRIWPALAVVTCVASLLIGPAVTTWSLQDYFRSPLILDYFSQLYLDIRLLLPGVFEDHPWHAVNGSLWTIPLEVRWYGILLVAGLFGLLKARARYLLLAVVSLYAIYIYGFFDVQHNPQAGFLGPDFGCEYGTLFCYGVVMYRFGDQWRRHARLVFGLLSLLAAMLIRLDRGYSALYVVLPFLVIWFGASSTPVLRRFGRYGDFSYGIYIYAFLVQQLLVSLMRTDRPFLVGLAASSTMTLACAALSWRWIEHPALGLKSRLRGSSHRACKDMDMAAPLSLPASAEEAGLVQAVPTPDAEEKS